MIPYPFVFVLWAVALGWIVARAWRGRPTAGLALAHWTSLALVHLFAEIVYAWGDYWSPVRQASVVGFETSGFAVAGLILGLIGYDLLLDPRRPPGPAPAKAQSGQVGRLGGGLLLFGGALYLVGLTGVYSYIPSASAIFSSATGLIVAGICLKWYTLRAEGRVGAAWAYAIGGTASLPLLTTVSSGFIGYGVMASLGVCCFLLVSIRRYVLVVLPLAPIVLYFGLSLWVTYAASRGAIRAAVWGGEALGNRLDVVQERVLGQWVWLDLEDQAALDRLERLDQNQLVGEAVLNLRSGAVEFADGESLWNSALALIPRAIWLDKPQYAGSGDWVARYTGRTFAQGTSVGIGQVMELYTNFGVPGLVIGFAALGMLVSWLDGRAGAALAAGDARKFLFAFVAGLPLMIAQGNFAEMWPAMVGGGVLAFGAVKVLGFGPARAAPARPAAG